MPCRVGITTDPQKRKLQWERRVVGLTNWKLLGKYHGKENARQKGAEYAATAGCNAHSGGPDIRGPWYVYRFDYIRTR